LGLYELRGWIRGWCPRDSLLDGLRLQRVSSNAISLRSLFREHPMGFLLTILILTAGLGGFLIPKTFAPVKAEIWILTESHLSLSGYVDGFERQVSTVITTPYGESEAPSAVIFIRDEKGKRELESLGLATTFISFPSRNVTVARANGGETM
jgi:hypothetical protein